MALFVIAVAAVAAAILWLWVKQRRERGTVETIDGFRSSLEKLSTPTPAERELLVETSVEREDLVPDASHERASGERRVDVAPHPARASGDGGARLAPLTPERRAAARERIAERRRAMRSAATR